MAQINYKSELGRHLVCIKPEIRGENISETAGAPHHRNPGHLSSGPGGVTAVPISRDTLADDTASEKVNLNLLPHRKFPGAGRELGIRSLQSSWHLFRGNSEV